MNSTYRSMMYSAFFMQYLNQNSELSAPVQPSPVDVREKSKIQTSIQPTRHTRRYPAVNSTNSARIATTARYSLPDAAPLPRSCASYHPVQAGCGQ